MEQWITFKVIEGSGMTFKELEEKSVNHESFIWQNYSFNNEEEENPGWVAQLIKASSQYAKVADSNPSQVMYKNQPMNA